MVVVVVVVVGVEDESRAATEIIEGGGGNDARIWTMVERKYIPFWKKSLPNNIV